MQQPILIILHQEHSTPGRVGNALQQLGYALDIRRPRFGDPLPQTMADHAASIIFGGPMSANDQDDFIRFARATEVQTSVSIDNHRLPRTSANPALATTGTPSREAIIPIPGRN